MPRLQLPDGAVISYESTGDGFPLVLLPGPEGIAGWLPHMPLLGEICRTVAYECGPRQPAVECLPALLGALRVEACYLACPLPGWLPAAEFAHRHPGVLEALFLVDLPGSDGDARPPARALTARLSATTLPTLVLLASDASPARPAADRLATRLPHCRTVTMGRRGQDPPGLPRGRRQFPHLMMRFLVDRERHRNLVRGASFLL